MNQVSDYSIQWKNIMSEELQSKLKAARLKLNISQSEAAKLWEVPLKTLQSWEANRFTPKGFTLAALTKKLDKIIQSKPKK